MTTGLGQGWSPRPRVSSGRWRCSSGVPSTPPSVSAEGVSSGLAQGGARAAGSSESHRTSHTQPQGRELFSSANGRWPWAPRSRASSGPMPCPMDTQAARSRVWHLGWPEATSQCRGKAWLPFALPCLSVAPGRSLHQTHGLQGLDGERGELPVGRQQRHPLTSASHSGGFARP